MRLKPIHRRIIEILSASPERLGSFDLWHEGEVYTMNEIEAAISELAAMGNDIVLRIKWRRGK